MMEKIDAAARSLPSVPYCFSRQLTQWTAACTAVKRAKQDHGIMIVDEKGQPIEQDEVVPRLTERQQEEAESRTKVAALVVHETIRKDGDEELRRPTAALAWSGLAAGLSMGFSFLTESLIWNSLPASSWRPLITNLGYPVGFLIVIIGRQQLFTENTLTAIIPLLARRNLATLISVLRLWVVVLVANLAGAHFFAWVVSNTSLMALPIQEAMRQVATAAAAVSPGNAVLRGIFAAWLIAMVVWMLAATDSSRIAIIGTLTYVGLANLTHVVVGSVEVLFLVNDRRQDLAVVFDGVYAPHVVGQYWSGVSHLYLR
jgi:formate/nitrite transporter FocA (FNT family)